MEIRTELISTILEHFVADFNTTLEALPDTQDQIYYVEKIREFMLGIYQTRPASDIGEAVYFDENEFIRRNLFARFHEKMNAFNQTRLRYYFCKEAYHQNELFKKLNITQNLLHWKEYEGLSRLQLSLLNKQLDELYLLPHSPDNKGRIISIEETIEEKPKSKDYTRSRQALTFHYLMASLGYNKTNANHVKLAELAHVLFAYPLDKIENSHIYKNIKNAPLHLAKTKATTLKDLYFVRTYFEAIQCTQALKLIDEDISYIERNKKPD